MSKEVKRIKNRFATGTAKPEGSGRKKGVPNKKTVQWQNFTDYCLGSGLEKFEKEMKTLKGRSFVDMFLKLLEFHKPKLSRTTVTDEEGKAMPAVMFYLPNNYREQVQKMQDEKKADDGKTE